MRFIVGAL